MKFNESKYCNHAVKVMLVSSVGLLSTFANANQAPVVKLTSPAEGATFIQGEKVTIEANAFDRDGKISYVDFYRDGVRIARDKTAPYGYTAWSGFEGNHDVYAVAVDNNNSNTLTDSLRYTVTLDQPAPPPMPPAVTLTAPANGASFVEGQSVVIEANASDSDGNIARVDFYSNGQLLGSDTSAPYSHNWSGSAGSHSIHAVAVDNDKLTTKSDVNHTTIEEAPKGKLVTYPANNEIKNKYQSSRYAVFLTQKGATTKSFVYQEDNNAKPGWSGALDYMQNANHWTNFSLEGDVEVQARRLDGKNINTCIVRPLSLGIKTEIAGNNCHFKLDKPVKISVEIDDGQNITRKINNMGMITKNIVKHPLFIFANPMEVNAPSAKDKNVLYFGPGIHTIGKKYRIANNTHVYIAGGAHVIGNFVSAENNPQNIVISGRGILSGRELTETQAEHNAWGNHAIDFSKGSKGSGLKIEGITIISPLRSCIVAYNAVDIVDVKMMSWNHRNDGIVAGNNSLIENNFIKVMDDNIKLYYSNQVVRNNVVWQQTSGAVFKFAWSLGGVAQNNQISNIDIIHSDVFTDYAPWETDRADMQATSAVFSAMGFKKNAAFKNNSFKNIRIEEEHLIRLMSLRMVTSHLLPTGKLTVWGNDDPNASKEISNLEFDNISLAGVPYKPITLYGNAGGVIKNISFSNLSIGNEKMYSRSHLSSHVDGTGMMTAGKVSNISFK